MVDSTVDSFAAAEGPRGDADAIRELVEEDESWPLARYAQAPGGYWVRLWNAWLMVALGFIEALLAFRFGLLLTGGNPENGFVDIIYHLSKPLAAPFNGIVASRKLGSDGLFEPSILVGMLAYLVAAILTMSIAWAIAASERTREPR